MLVGSVGFIYFHLLRPLPPPRANKELYFYVHYFRTIFEFLSPILEGRFLWEWWLFRIFLRTKLSFFLTARQSQSYRKHWKETQEKERRKVRAVSTKCWDNARLRTVSLFCWCVEQNAQDTQMTTRVTEGTRWERHEKGEATLFFFSGRRPRFSLLSDARARVHSPHKIWRKGETANCRVLVKSWQMLRSWFDQQAN